MRSARRRSGVVGVLRSRTLIGWDTNPARDVQRLVDVEDAAIAPPTLLGRCGGSMASFRAAAVEQDLGMPADFLEDDVLERLEFRGDDDEIERLQLNSPAWIIAGRRRNNTDPAASCTSPAVNEMGGPAWPPIQRSEPRRVGQSFRTPFRAISATPVSPEPSRRRVAGSGTDTPPPTPAIQSPVAVSWARVRKGPCETNPFSWLT